MRVALPLVAKDSTSANLATTGDDSITSPLLNPIGNLKFDKREIDGFEYIRIVQPNYIPDTDTILRAKWRDFAESLEELAGYSDLFAIGEFYPFLEYETLIRLATKLDLMRPVLQSNELFLEPNPSCLIYWCPTHEPINPRSASFFVSVLLRVNVAYLACKKILNVMMGLSQKSRPSALPPEISCLLRGVDELSSEKSTQKARTTTKLDQMALDSMAISTIRHGILLYQLRAFLLSHRPLIDYFNGHLADISDLSNPHGKLRLLYEADNRQYPMDYMDYGKATPNQLFIPVGSVFNVYNSKYALYKEVLRLAGAATAAAVLPLYELSKKILGLRCRQMPKFQSLQAATLHWFSAAFGVAENNVNSVGTVAIAIYYSVSRVEEFLIDTNKTSDAIDVNFASWLHIMDYIDIVRCFQRTQLLTDNVVPAYLLHSKCRRVFSEFTLCGDKTMLSHFDPEYAPFLGKFDIVKQFIKAFFPQKNLSRDIYRAIEENIIDEQREHKSTNNKFLPYYTRIIGMLLCTLTGGYKHTRYRVNFVRSVAMYSYFTQISVTEFAHIIGRFEQPIRFILREYVRYLSLSSTQHGAATNSDDSSNATYGRVNYATIHRATINVCNYMRTVVNAFTGSMEELCAALISATASVTSSQQAGAEVKAICGGVHLDLRKLNHPLVAMSKGPFPDFLYRTIYAILQDNYERYMMVHEQLEALSTIIDDINAVQRECEAQNIKLTKEGYPENVTLDNNGHANREPIRKFQDINNDIIDYNRRFYEKLHFPECLKEIGKLHDQCVELAKLLEHGKLIYILTPKEKTEIFHMFLNPDSETTDKIVNWFSPIAQIALEDINKKCEQSASEKSAANLLRAHLTAEELIRMYFLLNCRQFLIHELVPAPRALEKQILLAMHTMRLFVTIPGVPDNAFDIQFRPCCNQVATYTLEHRTGNASLVYNPDTCMFECSNVVSTKQTTPVLLRPTRYIGLLPYYGTISRDNKKSNRRKLARLALLNNIRIPCNGTPVFPICLKNKRLLFNNGDGETTVYYHCPTCARLTEQALHSEHVTLGMCDICQNSSVFALHLTCCFICKMLSVRQQRVLLIDEQTNWAIVTICRGCNLQIANGEKDLKSEHAPGRMRGIRVGSQSKKLAAHLFSHYHFLKSHTGHSTALPVLLYRSVSKLANSI